MGTQAIIFDRDNTLVAIDSTRVEAIGVRLAALAPALPAGAFLAVAAALGPPPGACAVVDELRENVMAARSIGMRGVLIDRSLPPTATAADRIGPLGALPELRLPPFICA